MNKNYFVALYVVALLSLFIGLQKVVATQDPQQLEAITNLTLEVNTTKTEFLRLEPLPLIISLSNQTEQPITGHTSLMFSENRIKVFIGSIGNELREVQELSSRTEFVKVSTKTFEPGEKYQSNQLLTLNLDKLFPTTGTYQIQTSLKASKGSDEIKSNILTVEITEPSAIDAQAMEFLKNSGKASDFFSGRGVVGRSNAEGKLKEFVDKFSGTAYGDYAVLLLGEVYFAKQDYKNAFVQLDKLKEKKNFALAEKVSLYLKEIKEKKPGLIKPINK